MTLTPAERAALRERISEIRRSQIVVHTGCDCDLCTGKRIGRTVNHGTETAYGNSYRCRCDACRDAATSARKRRRDAA